MNRTTSCLLLAGLVTVLCSCTSPAKSPAGQGTFASAESKGTVITAHLDQPIEPGKNVLWCASFQIAWNELMDFAGGPIVMHGDPPMARALNRRAVERGVVDPRCLVARCGLVGDGIIPSIMADLKKTFGDDAKPELLPKPEERHPTDVIAYAYLQKLLPFETAFRAGGRIGFPTTQADLAAFGIPQYRPDNEDDARRARQVRIVWYSVTQDEKTGHEHAQFVVELKPRQSDERILLAKVQPGPTLAATVDKVLGLVAKPNTVTASAPEEELRSEKVLASAELAEYESLTIPVLDLKLKRDFDEVCHREISSPARLQMAWIEKAVQLIRFRLDENGAAVKSEALIVGLWGEPRHYRFDGPFLLMLIRKDSAKPYLALWVGNHELMVPAKPEPEPVPASQPSGPGIF